MYYNLLALLVLLVGVFVLFSRNTMKMILLSLVPTLVIFFVIITRGLFLLSVVFLILDIFIKLKLFIFLINKEKSIKKLSFKKEEAFMKFLGVGIISCMTSIMYLLNTRVGFKINTNKILMVQNELAIISIIVTVFLISGYVVKSKKWNS